MAKKSTNNNPSYGLILIIFGLIFLLSKTGILKHIPYGGNLMSVGSFFLIAGIVFLCTRSEKTLGIVFTAIGVLMNFDLFFGWAHNFSSLIVPIVLIVLGIVMVIRSKR